MVDVFSLLALVTIITLLLMSDADPNLLRHSATVLACSRVDRNNEKEKILQ